MGRTWVVTSIQLAKSSLLSSDGISYAYAMLLSSLWCWRALEVALLTSVLSTFPYMFPNSPSRAQDVFRQAMKAPCVLLHVLPPQNREQYEKSVIGPLNIFGNNDGVSRTKPPPPVHPRSGIKTVSLTETSSPEEDGSPSLQQSKSPRVPRIGRKPSSPSLSPLMGFGSKKNAKKIKIDLKKGNY